MSDSLAAASAKLDTHEYLLVQILVQLSRHVPGGLEMLGEIVINAEQQSINDRRVEGSQRRSNPLFDQKSFASFTRKLNLALGRSTATSIEHRL